MKRMLRESVAILDVKFLIHNYNTVLDYIIISETIERKMHPDILVKATISLNKLLFYFYLAHPFNPTIEKLVFSDPVNS